MQCISTCKVYYHHNLCLLHLFCNNDSSFQAIFSGFPMHHSWCRGEWFSFGSASEGKPQLIKHFRHDEQAASLENCWQRDDLLGGLKIPHNLNPENIHSQEHDHKEKICSQQPSNTPIEATSRWINIGGTVTIPKCYFVYQYVCTCVFF